MQTVVLICQIVAALGILNVWLLRPGRATGFRGGAAKNMKEEFAVYGLPVWFMYAIGILKVSLALCLLVGIWIPTLVQPAAIGLATLMAGAVVMHVKVKDPCKKYVPALCVLTLSVLVAVP